MHLLVDGHNLIAQMPGIDLADDDDEAQLVMLLRRYALARRGREVIVVFDRGVYGHPQRLDGYGVTCQFARSPQDADTQLIQRIASLRSPRSWSVVTADRQIIQAAKTRGVKVIDSRAFARTLLAVNTPAPRRESQTPEKPDRALSPQEVEEWLRLFNERDDNANRS